jgi:hypothetical protein
MNFYYYNSLITDVVVDPMIPYGNDPSIYMCLKDKVEQNTDDKIYKKSNDGCYYYQGENGETDFVYHGGDLRLTDKKSEEGWPIYETVKNLGGFCGDVFVKKVWLPEGYAIVKIGGPWSGGCYCANDVLPKKAIEVTISDPQYGCMIGCCNLTIEKMQPLLDHFDKGWRIVTEDDGSYSQTNDEHTIFPQIVYENKTKKYILEKEGKEVLTKKTEEAHKKFNYWVNRKDMIRHAQKI